MHKPFPLVVKQGKKTWRNSKEVISSVLQRDSIPEGDVGAYIVGVFACQPLTKDGKSYNRTVPGQWNHCLYKDEWSAALQGMDQFTDEQKSLILAGYDLLKKHSHGWGDKATAQYHVRKLLDAWRSQIKNMDTSPPIGSFRAAEQVVSSNPRARSKPIGNSSRQETHSGGIPTYDEVVKLIESKPSSTLFDIGRAWLIEHTLLELPGFNRRQVKVIIDLHLDPRNYVLDRIFDYESIRAAILRGEDVLQVSRLLVFEDITTILGVFRVHCRNAVNRQGVSDINGGGANHTKAPKILTFLDSLDDTNWYSFDRVKNLAGHYVKVIKQNRSGIFSRTDLKSMTIAREVGNSLLSMRNEEVKDSRVMQGWVKALKCISGGVSYLNQFNMDVGRFMGYVLSGLKTYKGTIELLRRYRSVPEIGTPLAANFFADLGFKEFCKPDTHVCDVVNGLYGTTYSDQEVFDRMLILAKDSNVPPRKLDKVFYFAGSGNFYLINSSFITGKKGSGRRKQSLVHHLGLYIKNKKDRL